MPTTETHVTPPSITLAFVAALLLAGGCDGGIFGTGDGSPSPGELTISASPTDSLPDGGSADSVVEPPPMAGPPSSAPDDTDTADLADAEVDDPQPTTDADMTLASQTLVNTLVADPTASEPRLRVLNTGPSGIALVGEGSGSAGVGLPFVAAGTASAYVSMPDGVSSLTLGRVQAPGDEPELSSAQRLGPLLLDPASVTTLLVRDAPGAVAVAALPTLLASDDSELALVRLVTGGGIQPADGGPVLGATYTLVPGGANPGGVAVELGSFAFGGEPAADYLSVPAGDYRLESSTPALPAQALSFTGGSVRTLVVFESGELLVVADGG